MGPSVTNRVRPNRVLVAVATLVAGALLMASPPPPDAVVAATAQRAPAVQSGRSVVVSLRSVVGNVVVADTGEVRDPALSPVRRSVVNLQSPVVRAEVANASVTMPDPESVRSEASVTRLGVDLLGEGIPLLRISLRAVRVASHSSCTAPPSSEVEIGSLSINDIEVTVGRRLGVDARVTVAGLPLVSVVLNEQIRSPRGNGLTVNAVHITVANLVDLVVASAQSNVADCPARDDREPPVVEVVSGIARRGRVAVARGTGFPPSAPVRFTFDGPDLRPIEAMAGQEGTVEVAVVVPRDAGLGMRTVTAASGDRSATASFLVVRLPAQPPLAPFEPD